MLSRLLPVLWLLTTVYVGYTAVERRIAATHPRHEYDAAEYNKHIVAQTEEKAVHEQALTVLEKKLKATDFKRQVLEAQEEILRREQRASAEGLRTMKGMVADLESVLVSESTMRSDLVRQRVALRARLSKLESLFDVSQKKASGESMVASPSALTLERKKLFGRCPRDEDDESIALGLAATGAGKCQSKSLGDTFVLGEAEVDHVGRELSIKAGQTVLQVDSGCGTTAERIHERLGAAVLGTEEDADKVAHVMTKVTSDPRALYCVSPYLHWLPRKAFHVVFTLSPVKDCEKLHQILSSVRVGGVLWLGHQQEGALRIVAACRGDLETWNRLEGATLSVEYRTDISLLGTGMDTATALQSCVISKFAWAPPLTAKR